MSSKTGQLSKGLILDMPLTTEWMQDASTVSDKSATHAHGAVNGATVGASSTDFDGTTDDIDLSNLLIPITNLTTGSIAITGNIDVDDGNLNVLFSVSRDADATLTDFFVFCDMRAGEDRIAIILRTDGTSQWMWESVADAADAFVGVDLRVMVVQDGVEPKIYFNGIENTTGSFTVDVDKTLWFKDLLAAGSPPDVVNIGTTRRNGADTFNFDGQINNLKIWNRELTASEVLLDYQKHQHVNT